MVPILACWMQEKEYGSLSHSAGKGFTRMQNRSRLKSNLKKRFQPGLKRALVCFVPGMEKCIRSSRIPCFAHFDVK